jgi:hypothetical protein
VSFIIDQPLNLSALHSLLLQSFSLLYEFIFHFFQYLLMSLFLIPFFHFFQQDGCNVVSFIIYQPLNPFALHSLLFQSFSLLYEFIFHFFQYLLMSLFLIPFFHSFQQDGCNVVSLIIYQPLNLFALHSLLLQSFSLLYEFIFHFFQYLLMSLFLSVISLFPIFLHSSPYGSPYVTLSISSFIHSFSHSGRN